MNPIFRFPASVTTNADKMRYLRRSIARLAPGTVATHFVRICGARKNMNLVRDIGWLDSFELGELFAKAVCARADLNSIQKGQMMRELSRCVHAPVNALLSESVEDKELNTAHYEDGAIAALMKNDANMPVLDAWLPAEETNLVRVFFLFDPRFIPAEYPEVLTAQQEQWFLRFLRDYDAAVANDEINDTFDPTAIDCSAFSDAARAYLQTRESAFEEEDED
jgi:hypothetical protein